MVAPEYMQFPITPELKAAHTIIARLEELEDYKASITLRVSQ